VASVLVYIETAGDAPSSVSLEALGEGRRVATSAGATLYALAVVTGTTSEHRDLVGVLGDAGADRVMLRRSPQPESPALWATVGDAIFAACEEVAPLMVFLPASAAGRDVGPRLAARMGAVFVSEPSIQRGPRGEVVLSRSLYGGTYRRRYAVEDLEHPVVVTLTPGSYSPAAGDDEPAYLPSNDDYAFDEAIEATGTTEDPGAALATARIVVTAGGGVRTESDFALIAALAEALGGEVGATRAVCDRGLAPAEREIGVGARHVTPTLYIACAASGSSAHLGAVSSDAEIVAINRDPDAPIFKVASYGLVGEVADLVPALIEALRARSPVAATS
jgi:electron transfer flavoprotein alpha subunit